MKDIQSKKFRLSPKNIIMIATVLLVAGIICIGIYAYSLINNPDVITIGVGENYTLDPDKDDYIIRSYNAKVVSPSSGSNVVGNTTGEAVVCIKYNYFVRDFYRFRVIPAPQTVSLDKSQLQLGVGENHTLSATCISDTHRFSISYSSSDSDIATIDENGLISAVGTGECEIKATSYNNVESVCKLTVSDAPTSINFSDTTITMGVGESVPLTPTFNDGEFSNALTYKSDNEQIVSASKNAVTALKAGECTVTATTYNGHKASCKVVVKNTPQQISVVTLDKYSVNSHIDVIAGMPSDCAAYSIDVTVSDDSVLKIDEKSPMLIHCIKEGQSDITLTLQSGVSATKTITVGNYTGNQIKDFKILNQYPTLPTGCEVVSLTSVLNHYGMDVSMTTMADEYLPYYNQYPPNPNLGFLGDPYSRDGAGCYAACIKQTADNYFTSNSIDDYVALDISGCTPYELFDYLQNNVPVVTWVTSGFVTPWVDSSWIVNGETITWCSYEHCLVTTGYDKNAGTVTVADDSGGYTYTVSMSKFKEVFLGMDSMAVVILKK